jgi:sugar-specific transcriptional regulator TrmB
MEHIPAGLVKSLTAMGLSTQEARVYAALVLFDRAEARDLVDYLGISKPSVYDVLERLEEIGLAVRLNAKPVRYGAVSPEIAVQVLMDAHEEAAQAALRDLRVLEKEKVPTDATDTLWTVYGERNLAHKIREMLKHAEHRISCVTAERYLVYLEPIQGRDIDVQLRVFSDDPALSGRLKKQFPGKDVQVISPGSVTGSREFAGMMSAEVRSHIRMDFFLQIIVDDAEMLFIQPVACSRISALGTTNPGIIQFVRATNAALLDRLLRAGTPKEAGPADPHPGAGDPPPS